jgi:hypothetical protein
VYRYAWVVLYYKRGHNVFCRYKDMHEHATVTYIVCAESRQGKATTNYVGSVFVTMISTRYDVFHGTRRPSGLVSRSQSGRQSQMVDVGSTGRLVLDKQRVVGKWVGRAGQGRRLGTEGVAIRMLPQVQVRWTRASRAVAY